MQNLKEILKKVFETIKKPEMRILPGQLAFFLLLSIIPIFAMVATLASQFSLSIETLIHEFSHNMPDEVTDFIMQIINQKNININIIIFCISGFILASNGPHSMIISSNRLYKIQDSDFLNRRIKAIIMTIILISLLLFIIAVPVFGDKIVALLMSAVSNSKIENIINISYHILKYPTTIIIIYAFIKLLYTMAPDKTIKSIETTTGAIVTTTGWILVTEVYSFYVSYFARYNLLYGSVANLLILFLWIYLLSYVFVLGMAINARSHEEEFEK